MTTRRRDPHYPPAELGVSLHDGSHVWVAPERMSRRPDPLSSVCVGVAPSDPVPGSGTAAMFPIPEELMRKIGLRGDTAPEPSQES